MSIRLNPNIHREKRPFFTPDFYKTLGAVLTVLGTVGSAVIARSLLHMDTLGESADGELMLTQGQGMAMVYVLLLRMGETMAWVLFARLAVSGFHYTRNPSRYMLRLLVTALISEIPFDLCAYGTWFSFQSQNVVFALALGVWVLYLCENVVQSAFGRGAVMVGGVLWALLLNVENGFPVVIAMLLFHFLENRKLLRSAVLLAFSAADILVLGPILGLVVSTVPVGISLLLLRRYDDSIEPRLNRWIFYVIYPLHLIIIAILCATVLA